MCTKCLHALELVRIDDRGVVDGATEDALAQPRVIFRAGQDQAVPHRVNLGGRDSEEPLKVICPAAVS